MSMYGSLDTQERRNRPTPTRPNTQILKSIQILMQHPYLQLSTLRSQSVCLPNARSKDSRFHRPHRGYVSGPDLAISTLYIGGVF